MSKLKALKSFTFSLHREGNFVFVLKKVSASSSSVISTGQWVVWIIHVEFVYSCQIMSNSVFTVDHAKPSPVTTALPVSLHRLIFNGHLSKLLDSGHCLLYLRHSDRPPLPPGSYGPHVDLTSDGVIRARQLGIHLKELSVKPGALISSPLARNIQTLNEICNGAGWTDSSNKMEFDKRIVGPGTIYEEGVDVNTVIASYRKAGLPIYQVFNEIARGNHDRFVGVNSIEHGAAKMVSYIKEVLDRPVKQGCLSLMVSHDINVAYILAHLHGIRVFNAETWPPFLDGILFQRRQDGKNLVAMYGDHTGEFV